jgi:crotonobetainyl-CoA:carnitine CoA-transferase CaiB-like acyl-CoA transferase
MGNAHVNIVPYQVFETAPKPSGERDHLIVAVGNDGQFAKLCEILGRSEWALDPRFTKNPDRVRHRDVLVPLLAEVLKTRTKAQWLADFDRLQVPGAPINQLDEVFVDPQVQARGMVETLAHPIGRSLQLVASPIKMSETPVATRRPPPMLGEHTDEVLRDWLGWSDSQIDSLRQQSVID